MERIKAIRTLVLCVVMLSVCAEKSPAAPEITETVTEAQTEQIAETAVSEESAPEAAVTHTDLDSDGLPMLPAGNNTRYGIHSRGYRPE